MVDKPLFLCYYKYIKFKEWIKLSKEIRIKSKLTQTKMYKFIFLFYAILMMPIALPLDVLNYLGSKIEIISNQYYNLHRYLVKNTCYYLKLDGAIKVEDDE